jgi:general secretion pathway protein L
VDSVGEHIAAALSLPVEIPDLMAANAIFCPETVQSQWHGPLHDRALALALQGFKRPEINLRKDHFAKKRNFLKSKRHIQGAMAAMAVLVVSLLGVLWYNYHALQQRDQSLGDEMTAIFQQTFPGVAKVRDPFVEMQARVKSATGPSSLPPMLQGNKRILGLLADISARIPASLAVRVNRLTIDREAMAIKGTIDTFNAVETMKSALAASPKFKSVQIVSATADKDKKNGGVRFELQLQLEGL